MPRKVQPVRNPHTHSFRSAKSLDPIIPSTAFRLDKFHVVACWSTVVVFHVGDVAFLVATTRLYYWMLHDPLAKARLLDSLSFDVSYHTLGILSWGFAAVASLHGLVLALFLYKYCRENRERCTWLKPVSWLLSSSRKVQIRSKNANGTQLKSIAPQRPGTTNLNHLLRTTTRWIHQMLYIDGEYFDDFFLLQECAEVVAQIYQAYRMSIFIATRWINNVFVGMVCLNCVSTPLIQRLIPTSKMASRRLCEIIMSELLNFINSVVIPVMIFMKYVRDYDPNLHFFPHTIVFDDVWYVKAIRENQQLFVTSLLDFLSTLWPHFSILNCIMICESMLHFHQMKAHQTQEPSAGFTAMLDRQASRKPKRPHQRMRMAVHTVLRAILCLAGVVVLVLHLDAQAVPQIPGCKLQATPWLKGHKSSCVVLNVNCYRRGIQGKEAEIGGILSVLNTQTLVTLILTHCPALVMPSIIRDFHQLDGIEIYNSSLRAWPMESSLRDQDFPLLEYLYLLRSNTSGFPEALAREPMPSFLGEMILFETKLDTLPAQTRESWADVFVLGLERCQLPHVPEVLDELAPAFLYLEGNPIHNMSLDLFANQGLYSLGLSGTPLAHLPEQTTNNLTQLARLLLEFTELEQVPAYIQQWYRLNLQQGNKVVHSLFGSPFCHKNIQGENEASRLEREYQQQVCAKDLGSINGIFPIEIVAAQRGV